jgi:HsdM N-terminal domain
VSDARRLVDKLWSYCNVLRDDGVSTVEYTERLTYLLFLKMAQERETRPLKPERIDDVPAHPGAARPSTRHAGRHLPQGAEPDPGPRSSG